MSNDLTDNPELIRQIDAALDRAVAEPAREIGENCRKHMQERYGVIADPLGKDGGKCRGG